jgi:hypothetical protein
MVRCPVASADQDDQLAEVRLQAGLETEQLTHSLAAPGEFRVAQSRDHGRGHIASGAGETTAQTSCCSGVMDAPAGIFSLAI